MAVTSNYIGPSVYVAKEDVTETLPDGRTIQIAVKGAEYPMAEAVKLGLVKEGKAQGPTEKKPAAGPTEVKASAADADDDEEDDDMDNDADNDNVDAADTNPPPTPTPAPAPKPTPKGNRK